MTPERWATINRVWHAVLARPDTERAAAIAELCAGDEEMRAEIESLLASLAHASAAGFAAAPGLATGSGSLIGHRLGPYSVHALLGVGGMGEVYQAHDLTLGRDVALKILPNLWLADTDRRARFDREARVLASLNHTNIGAIYGVHESDDFKALVLELVEGETLADRILRQPLLFVFWSPAARPTCRLMERAQREGGSRWQDGLRPATSTRCSVRLQADLQS